MSDFLEYYSNLSAMTDDDNYFQMLLWTTWNMQSSGGADSKVIAVCVCVCVCMIEYCVCMIEYCVCMI